jgi:outer membrane protein assembly factor BamB
MMEPLQPGDPRVAGQFRLRARLGAGGMGRVFLGYSPAGRAVAVKVCHPELAADPDFVRRFAREVAAARAVNGVYTAQVVDAGPDDEPPWLATSYVPGPSLYEAVSAGGPLPEPAVWRLAAGLAEALQAVHARGLVHRDLKPTNVLLAADGPRVIDFGVARALDGASLTATGITFGTPSYMSPEQVRGRPAGPASDVFALGGTLCFAAAGAPAFGDGDPPAVLDRVVRAAPVLDAVPAGLRGLIAACLAKAPADRPGLPEILRACQARAPQPGDPDYGSTSFWPGQVAALIAAHQSGPDGAAPAREPDGAAPSREPDGEPTSGAGYLGRRRALAGLAVVAAAGLGTAGWALTRPGGAKPAAAHPPGRLLWARDTGGPVSSGAAAAGGVVYIGGADGVHAFEAATGRPVKTYRTGGAVLGAVTAAGATLFAGSDDNRVYAWSVAPGGSSWQHTTGGPVRGRPAVAAGVVCVGSDDHDVYAFGAGTGQVTWRYPTGGRVRSSPQPTRVSFNDFVYVGSEDGSLYALEAKDGTLGWRFATGGPVESGPVTDSGGAVYVGNNRGDIYEVDGPPADGVWKFPGRGSIQGTPVTDGAGTLYAGSADGFVYAVSLPSGGELWAYRAGGPVLSGPALAGGMLYVGSDDGYLHAIDVTTGAASWRYRTGGAIRSQILTAGGVIYFGSLDHRAYALRVQV